ncbi:hypothetical protein OAD53_04045 [Gammaproteobacteria bacterium]|nr:hypothetical protein [Gammaproteobacteria bacterium]
MKKVEMFKLELVVPIEKQTEELYRQLSARPHNISHTELPIYEKHKEFVTNHPYRAWFIIWQNKIALGNAYIQYDNSIGLNCVDEISELQIKKILNLLTSEFQPLDPVPSLRIGKFFINIASSNIQLQEKLKSIGLIESQRSFIHDL